MKLKSIYCKINLEISFRLCLIYKPIWRNHNKKRNKNKKLKNRKK